MSPEENSYHFFFLSPLIILLINPKFSTHWRTQCFSLWSSSQYMLANLFQFNCFQWKQHMLTHPIFVFLALISQLNPRFIYPTIYNIYPTIHIYPTIYNSSACMFNKHIIFYISKTYFSFSCAKHALPQSSPFL